MSHEDFVEYVMSSCLNEIQDLAKVPHDIQMLIRATMKETAKDCILQLQLKILRNGDTPENRRSWSHIDDISKRYGIDLGNEMKEFTGNMI